MLATLLWGFSRTLWMAILARALQGAANGDVGIIRTTVAEMVPFRELQPRAFSVRLPSSIMPLIWTFGAIAGPALGGALANPLNVQPGEKIEHPNFLQRYPYALPNLICAGFFTFGITVGVLFLEETLETLKNKRDYGLRLGDKLKSLARSHVVKAEQVLGLRRASQRQPEDEPFLDDVQRSKDLPEQQPKLPKQAAPSIKEILTKQSIYNILSYALLALHNMAYDQLLPVYMSYPSLQSDSPYITKPSTDSPFLRFAGGFGLTHTQIGAISAVYGVVSVVVQIFFYPMIARRLGVLYCLKCVNCFFPFVYFLMPFTALLPNQRWQIGVCFVIMELKAICAIFAFPCSSIMITNSASSLRVLGTLNGAVTTTSAIGRAIGPAVIGGVFTLGVKRGYIVAAWWVMATFAVLGAIPVFWLVEGKGFASEEHEADGEVVDDEDDRLREEGLEGGAEAAGQLPILIPNKQQNEEEPVADANDDHTSLLTKSGK
ncbi:hypothetical protein LTR78_003543 [Recurvomyces mirabilis]|uniref:Major facilitator superfamily (MFS) profile domain-containing protein n=1 Tax=Recurvomyces mirabilis TaxID=574656 RepID=A0AAE0WRM7_9PEZI|nr:hypothetical protein LTR78_003543 [Recurvomyces mirabilis]KAK5154426.1 hypothetical protein LTS14_006561 [Recurvomyces mirabilis]